MAWDREDVRTVLLLAAFYIGGGLLALAAYCLRGRIGWLDVAATTLGNLALPIVLGIVASVLLVAFLRNRKPTGPPPQQSGPE